MKKCGFIKYVPGIASILAGGYIVCSILAPDLKGEVIERVKNFDIKSEFESLIDGDSNNKEEVATNEATDSSSEAASVEETESTTSTSETPDEEVIEEVIYDEKTDTYLVDHNYEFLDIDFNELNEKNEDMIGYIDFPDTRISYPVLQRENDENNDYYLHRNESGMPYYPGSIYLDTVVDLSLGDDSRTMQDRTITIYGHNMRNGSMFHDLRNFKDQSYVDNHQYGAFYNEDGSIYSLEVVAGYLTSGDSDENIMVYNIDNEESLDNYKKFIDENALVKTDVNVECGDKIVNLVTCSYEKENYRFVLVCKAVKQELNNTTENEPVERKRK